MNPNLETKTATAAMACVRRLESMTVPRIDRLEIAVDRLGVVVAELRHSANVAERLALSVCANELAAIEARATASLAQIEDDDAMRFVRDAARKALGAVGMVEK